MPAADFAAAQERIAARRAQRAAHARTQHASPPPARALARLPSPLHRLGTAGLSAWDAVKGREGTRPAFRVGQVDAELLDAELLDLLKAQVGEGLKYYGTHLTDTYAAEILLALRLVLFKLSIWNHNASYGAHLQGLRYTDARSTAPNRPPPKPWQKAAYGLLTTGGRYAWAKWEAYLLSAADDYTRPETAPFRFLTRATQGLANAHDVAALASFLVFLANGRYRTLTDRLLRLRLTPTSHATSREVSFEYLNRQLVWHAFTEFLLFLLPLVGISRWRRFLSRSARRLKSALLALVGRHSPSSSTHDDDEPTNAGPLAFLPDRTCAICYRDQNPTPASEADMLTQSASGGGVVGSAATDITNPYAADCGCVYCFACLAQRLAAEEGEGWTCLRCGGFVRSCAAWEGDVLVVKSTRRAGSQSLSLSLSHNADTAHANGHGKSVLFAHPDAHAHAHAHADADADSLLHIDPAPLLSSSSSSSSSPSPSLNTYTYTDTDPHTQLDHPRSLDLGDSLALTESSAWGRSSEGSISSEEEEEEEEEGE